MREINTCPEQNWQQMPTEELDKILQAELTKEEPDAEVVLPILHELEEREKDFPVDETPEILTKLNRFNKHETSSSQSRRKWVKAIAAIAAVICIIVMAIPRTVGADSIFSALVRWTSGVFEYIDPDKDYPDTTQDFSTEHEGLQQLYDKVTELGVTEPVVPMWIPEGFELSEMEVISMLDGDKVRGTFKRENALVAITYRVSADIKMKVEKEGSPFEVYDYAGVDHTILKNDNNLSVTWMVQGVECLINTNISRDELYTLIKSIYRSEL